MVDIIAEDIDVVASSCIVVETAEEVVIDGIERDIEVTFDNNEFSIVGDDMVVLTRYEDAPQWMKDVINNLVDVKTALAVGNLNATRLALDAMLAQLDVAKNTYTLSIISSNDIDSRITTAIETLNSSLQAADATILNIAQTAVTPSEASAIALNTLSASLTSNGTIGSALHNLQLAYANLDSTTASELSYLKSVMEGEISGNAIAMDELKTEVTTINGVVTSHAEQITLLQTSATSVDGKIATAKSEVINTVNTTISNGDAAVESKWAYNSNLTIGGISYNSGFGLSNSAGTGAGSEFWVDASRFKFTNSAKSGSISPFSIQASGASPEITFNGKVTFSNVTGVTASGSNLLYNSAPAIGRETEGWSPGWHNMGGSFTNNVVAGSGNYVVADGASVLCHVSGSPDIGTVFDMAQAKRIPIEASKKYELSAYLSCYRCTSEVAIVFYDSAGKGISEYHGSQVNFPMESKKLSEWGRSTLFITSPSNAASCVFFVRSHVSGTDPHCFVTHAYFGKALDNQTLVSPWSEGVGADKSSSQIVSEINAGTVTIDGGKLTAGSVNADKIEAYTITGNKIAAWTITADRIGAGEITANEIHVGSLTSDRITAGHIGTAITGTATNSVGALHPYPDESWSGGTIIGEVYYNNTLNTPVNVLVSVNGRTGFIGGTGNYYSSFKLFKDGVEIYRYGWTPSSQDSKSMAITTTVAANTISSFQVRGVKDSNGANYTLQSNLSISIIGVTKGANP